MQHSYEFRIIRFEPDARRAERVNIGLVVSLPKGVQVHLLKNMTKAQALAPQVRFHVSLQAELADMFTDMRATDSLASSQQLEPFSLSEPGLIQCEADELPVRIEAAMKRLVIPARRPSMREGNTRLHTEIKRQFRADGVLAGDASEITKHKVVADFEFPGDEELYADFAFKNGAWHLTQVLDYRMVTPAAAAKKIKEVSLKAIALDQASKETDRLLGDSLQVKTSAVVWVPDDLAIAVAPQIEIMGGYCANLYRFHNQDEQLKYWRFMHKLTGQHRGLDV